MTVDTLIQPRDESPRSRLASHKRFLMCRPTFFDVTYAINPWMDPSVPVDIALALAQWDVLKATFEGLGHTVDLVEPATGLPDMVFAANGGIVSDGRAMASRFAYLERQPEGALYLRWFEAAGLTPVVQASELNEGQGDVLRIGEVFLAGTGFRTSLAAHRQISEFFGREVVSLELVDPRFYHLDTALAVIDDETVAYYPPAFSEASLAVLRRRFPDTIVATASDADCFGLNAISDGHNVVTSSRATAMHEQLRVRGFNPIGVDLGELMKAGGSVKCCTLELHP